MADLYVKAPNGEVVVIDEADAQKAADSGYVPVDEGTIKSAQQHQVETGGADAAVSSGVLQAQGDYDVGTATAQKFGSALTFGLAPGLQTPQARAVGKRFTEEHPGLAFGAEVAGQLPVAAALEIGTAGVGGALGLAGRGLAARGAFKAADVGLQGLAGGAQTEAEEVRLSGEDFSWTDAAVTGLAGEALGRGAALGFSKALGASRNLLSRASREAVSQDAASSLTKGGMLNDFRVAHHAEAYQNELSTLAANDLDQLETSFAEVSRQDRKRARIVRVVEDHPEAQAAVRAEAQSGLAELYDSLSGELGDAPGPARHLLKQLDDRMDALSEAKGKRLWRLLDENRQALQEYTQDLHQAYENAPGSAWLSRDGLAKLEAAEKATRESLLREDVWGQAAAKEQAAYNVPFNEKYFPTAKTVRGKLMQTTQFDARGFPVFRGDPGKVASFFRREAGDVDAARLSEQFRDYLDGVEAIARAGERDTPKAARDTLEAVRRLRKASANAEYIQAAARRSADRGRLVEVGVEAGGAAAGLAMGGPLGGAVAFGALRGARAGDFLLRAGRRLGWGAGEAESMAALLGKDALPAAAGRDVPLGDDLVDDVLPSGRPPSGGPGSGGGPAPAGPAPGRGGLTPSEMAPDWAPSEAPDADVTVGPGATPSEAADALDPNWVPSEAPAAPSARPGRAERADTPTRPVGGERQVGAGQEEALYSEDLREVGPAQRREAKRLEALTEGEFRDVVRQLRATGTDEAEAFAKRLTANLDNLKTAGLVIAGAGAAALAADDQPEGAAGAAAAGLGLLATRGRGLSKLAGREIAEDLADRIGIDAIHIVDPVETGLLMTKRVGDAEGSNPGGWYESALGHRYYAKVYADPMQGVVEHAANKIYRLASHEAAPLSKLAAMEDGRLAYLSREVHSDWQTKTLDDITPDEAKAFTKEFWTDVLLANWDALGQNLDNVKFRAAADDGPAMAMRLDNGSSLTFRAQGAAKPPGALKNLTEIDGFFNAALNPNYATMLRKAGVTGPKDLREELKETLAAFGDGKLMTLTDALLPNEQQSILWQRFETLKHYADTLETVHERMLRENLGAAQRLGAMFHNKMPEAEAIVREAKADGRLPLPTEDDGLSYSQVQPKRPGKPEPADTPMFQLVRVSKDAANRLPEKEREAVKAWVYSSKFIRSGEQTGMAHTNPSDHLNMVRNGHDAEAFARAMDQLTVVDPTKHGTLFRFLDLDDRGVAEVLSRENFVVSAPTSTGYMPDSNFGAVEFRFKTVDQAGALVGFNPSEAEMVLLPGSRFKKVGQYYNPDRDHFVFEFETVPDTHAARAVGAMNVGHISAGPLVLGAGAAAAQAAAAGEPVATEDHVAAAAGAPVSGAAAAFGAVASLFKAGRGRLVRDVAKRLFSAGAEPALRTVARLAYSRSQLASRQEEFQSWQADPQQLVDRVAEGLRDATPDAFAKSAQGIYTAVAFLREKLPQSAKPNPVALRGVPVSAEAAAKYARYEQAALRPGEALKEASESKYLSPELLETLQELYPDLLADVRVEAYQAVRAGGPALSIQAKTQYARLFDGDGAVADPAFSKTAVQMINLAYDEQATVAPPKPSSAGVSQTAAAVAAPQPWRTG